MTEIVPAPKKELRDRPYSKLERGYVRMRLIRELAMGEKTHAALGEKYKCTAEAISEFKKRHRDLIDETAQDLLNELSSLWVADKYNRVAEYQQDIEDINEQLEADDLKPMDRQRLVSLKHAALRYVSEELGQLPGRVQVRVENQKVTYHVEGVDMEKLAFANQARHEMKELLDGEIVTDPVPSPVEYERDKSQEHT